MISGSLIDGGALNRMILYTTAMMETKSSMGVIVAAPTAGACGALPGAVLGATDVMGLSIEEATRALLAAGLIGVFIAAHATFAAEVGGCQAECGSGIGHGRGRAGHADGRLDRAGHRRGLHGAPEHAGHDLRSGGQSG